MRIDLNADVGEWTGDDPARDTDAALMAVVTTVSIACGGHAGGPDSMAATVELAASHGLAVGAHPGYPDPEGFGRRHVELTTDELRASLVGQVTALATACATRRVRLGHVKPHGALYNEAARDADLAHLIADVARTVDPRLALFGPPGSALLAAALDLGLRPVAETFADRAYEPDGSLRARSLPGAVHGDAPTVASQAVSLARDGRVRSHDGTWLTLGAQTMCLHGDSPGAVTLAGAVRSALHEAGIDIRRFDAP